MNTATSKSDDVGRKVITDFWMKPIPPRQFDWCAHFDGDEPDDDGRMMQGFGATEAEAVDDLLDQATDYCLTDAEQKAQAERCACRGSDDMCVCQNSPDDATRALRRAAAKAHHDDGGENARR